MKSVRNVLFSACVSVLLLACIVNAGLDFVQGVDKKQSFLEGRYYQECPAVTVHSFLEGDMQDETEQYFADLVPRRDSVLLGNAALQRWGITTANIPFGFQAYPTFFGSGFLACPSYEAIAEYPTTQDVATPELVGRARKAVETAVKNHDDVNWLFALVDRSRNSLSNPAHDLVENPADYDYYRTQLLEKLPASCPYVDLSIDDSDRYYDVYYHTDHHAQIGNALDAYQKIMKALDRKPIDIPEIREVYSGPFYGSEARSGLTVDYSDAVYDIVQPPADFTVEVNGKKTDLAWLNAGYGTEPYEKKHRFANTYAEYFHGDRGHIHITNPEGNGSLLIVGDSFTNNMDYLFAYSYHDVHIVDPRHYDGTLNEFLDENPVDDAVLLMASNTLVGKKMRAFLSK